MYNNTKIYKYMIYRLLLINKKYYKNFNKKKLIKVKTVLRDKLHEK